MSTARLLLLDLRPLSSVMTSQQANLFRTDLSATQTREQLGRLSIGPRCPGQTHGLGERRTHSPPLHLVEQPIGWTDSAETLLTADPLSSLTHGFERNHRNEDK